MLGTNKSAEEVTEEKGKTGIEAKLISMGIYEISLTALGFIIVSMFGNIFGGVW